MGGGTVELRGLPLMIWEGHGKNRQNAECLQEKNETGGSPRKN